MADPLPVALIGTGARSMAVYGPLLKGMADTVRLVSVWSRRASSAEASGKRFAVPWYTDLDRLVKETKPLVGIVCVANAANGEVGRAVVERGLHALLETPIAVDLAEADAIIEEARRRRVVVEVAEQFHRRPLEQLKLRLIESGIFGRVYAAFNDFAGHGYHGVSVLRSYLGFDKRPARVIGTVADFALVSHYSQIEGRTGPRTETQEHGIIEFATGEIGLFHWTSVGYDSALRWWRSSRFLAEKGMGISVGVGLNVEERLSVLAPDGEGLQFITIERVWERCDGGALVALKAHTGDPSRPVVVWENPFARALAGTNPQWHDDEIGVAGCIASLIEAVRTGGTPTYGAEQARLDQEIVIAIRRSAAVGGTTVHLPL